MSSRSQSLSTPKQPEIAGIETFEGGSRLHSVTEVNLPGLAAFVESAMKMRAQARFESDHRNLKRILES